MRQRHKEYYANTEYVLSLEAKCQLLQFSIFLRDLNVGTSPYLHLGLG